ncbi:MAG: hypothetical protein A3D31_01145 [Candidatus Fluviicola riflensis]|nr:MAG: hypothetical protein CHH17_04395 [Candidatus Fluviicola riflensis]OGS76212.1 MAG: hypothetical protein A3D31_01145 [Candidatus Fluviicola riflensis]OGS83244.1 MAG: hypothetical protein A2724_00695 [Fluviicola sp. RIFCSPHIGHO2_01_FULL_43_53]OGS83744.1 MAG: hypothetical protein A3E30_17750 [Fluviicola sp. RIFCSPHIGHO2_12_FULL_43_24]
MRLLIVGILFLLCSSVGSETTVYICDSPYATKYHYSKSCKGLEKCTHQLKELTLKEAQAKQYGLCGYEKKK